MKKWISRNHQFRSNLHDTIEDIYWGDTFLPPLVVNSFLQCRHSHPSLLASLPLSPVRKRVGFSKKSPDIWCIWQDFQFICLFQPTVLNLGPWIDFRGSVNLDGKKIKTLFPLTPKWNVAFLLIMNVGNKVIYFLWSAKMFDKRNKFQYLYLMHFTRLSKKSMEQKG